MTLLFHIPISYLLLHASLEAQQQDERYAMQDASANCQSIDFVPCDLQLESQLLNKYEAKEFLNSGFSVVQWTFGYLILLLLEMALMEPPHTSIFHVFFFYISDFKISFSEVMPFSNLVVDMHKLSS